MTTKIAIKTPLMACKNLKECSEIAQLCSQVIGENCVNSNGVIDHNAVTTIMTLIVVHYYNEISKITSKGELLDLWLAQMNEMNGTVTDLIKGK